MSKKTYLKTAPTKEQRKRKKEKAIKVQIEDMGSIKKE